MIEVIVTNKHNFREPQIMVHEREIPDLEAKIAISLVEKWGMVSGAEGGEVSTGRAKLRLMTPHEVVDRACETAEALVAELRTRKWFVAVAPYGEIADHAKKLEADHETAEEAARVKRAADRAEKK